MLFQPPESDLVGGLLKMRHAQRRLPILTKYAFLAGWAKSSMRIMQFTAGNADLHALELVKLLIQQGHYTAYTADTVASQIGKDIQGLAVALTGPNYVRDDKKNP